MNTCPDRQNETVHTASCNLDHTLIRCHRMLHHERHDNKSLPVSCQFKGGFLWQMMVNVKFCIKSNVYVHMPCELNVHVCENKYIYIYIWVTKFNPYRGALICCSLPVSFRRAGKVAMRFRDSLNRILAPFGYLRRAGEMDIPQLNGSVTLKDRLMGLMAVA
jgi:hypothetical protein